MGLLRRVALFSGKGPIAIVTAGIVSASVSIPGVTENVGSSCLEVADQARSLVTGRGRTGVEKNTNKDGWWNEAMEITNEEMSREQWRYPCYGFLHTRGGFTGNWERKRDENAVEGVRVKRECSKSEWNKIREGFIGWLNKNNAKGEGEKELKNGIKKELVTILKEHGESNESDKIIELVKRIQGLWKSNYNEMSDLYKEVSGTGGWMESVYEEIGETLELNARKIIELPASGKLIESLRKTPSFCATT